MNFYMVVVGLGFIMSPSASDLAQIRADLLSRGWAVSEVADTYGRFKKVKNWIGLFK